MTFPAQVEVAPGKVAARIFVHDIDARDGPIPCWTYVSQGLSAWQQSELVFTLRRRADETLDSFPREPLLLFREVYEAAVQGTQVEAGDRSACDGRDLFGFRGLVFVPAQALAGVEAPAGALAAIPLTGPEIAVANGAGSTRVLARLGQTYWHYPCPPWADRDRTSVVSIGALEQSLLAHCPRLHLPRASVSLFSPPANSSLRHVQAGREVAAPFLGNEITLLIPQRDLSALRDRFANLPDDAPLALLTSADPDANACCVWQPGQTRPEAIAPANGDVTRHTGCFLTFLPKQAENTGQICEDGFVIRLTEGSWYVVRQALTTGRDVCVPAASVQGISFTLHWTQPKEIHEMERVTPRGEQELAALDWQPAAAADSPRAVQARGTIYLTPGAANHTPEELGVDVHELVDHQKAMEQVVRDLFEKLPRSAGEDLYVQCEIPPQGQTDYKAYLNPGKLDPVVVHELVQQLAQLKPPAVRHDPFVFQVVFTLWGGSGKQLLRPE
jgi:hypothetical protein